MPYFSFDADDVAVGRDAAIFAQAGRRILVRHLSTDQVARIARCWRAGRFAADDLGEALMADLRGKTLVRDGHVDAARDAAVGGGRVARALRVPARTIALIARPLQPLTRVEVQLAVVVGVLGLLVSGVLHCVSIGSMTHWIATVTPSDALVACAVFFATTVIHELGHSAACLRLTGLTGSVRFTHYRGLPALASDVSAIALTDARGRASVAISGAITQTAFCALLLAVGGPAVRFGATLGLLSALFVATPLPMTDGYWLLRDLFGWSLKPRLGRGGTGHVSDTVYGWALAAMTLFFSLSLAAECLSMARAVPALLASAPFRALLVAALALYIGVVTGLFVVSNARQFNQESA
jgi:hypothetical protein